MNKKYHFIGIGGIGMSGLARILLEMKITVSGSDRAPNALTNTLSKLGATISSSHAKENVTSDMTIVYSSDVPVNNPEYQEALRLHCPILHRSDLLAEIMKSFSVLAVAGTHGKTTTSALLTAVVKESGLDPAFAVGGILKQYETNGGYGKGSYFVAEADESDGTFLKYASHSGIITNIGLDHLNHYGDEATLIQSFKTFANNTKHLFYCGDDERLNALSLKGVSYGFSERCELRASNYCQKGWMNHFDITYQGRQYKEVEVALIGKHNLLNALGIFGLALSLGITEEQIRQAFRTFGGAKRRAEHKWADKETLFIDDYAHHPTEIKTTLEGIRSAIGEKKLIAIYQPHRYSRIKDCLGHFQNVFDAADELIITDIHSAGEKPLPGVSHEPILKEVNLPSTYIPRSELAKYLSTKTGIMVTMGAGDITHLSDELLTLMESHETALK